MANFFILNPFLSRTTFIGSYCSSCMKRGQYPSLIRSDCTARQCSPLRRKFMECSINSPALSLLMKHLLIGQRLKTPNFSAFHWSPRGSLVRVVHLPKSTKTSLITESEQRGTNHQILQLCAARTAWFSYEGPSIKSRTNSTVRIFVI